MAEQMEVKHKQTHLFGFVLRVLKTLSVFSKYRFSIYTPTCLICHFL